MTNKTAERYMKLAKNKAKLLAELQKGAAEADDKFEMISNLSLAQAERLIAGRVAEGQQPFRRLRQGRGQLIEKLAALRRCCRGRSQRDHLATAICHRGNEADHKGGGLASSVDAEGTISNRSSPFLSSCGWADQCLFLTIDAKSSSKTRA